MRKALLALTVAILSLGVPALGQAKQHPRYIPHRAPPFGHFARHLCDAKPMPGQATCFGLVVTKGPRANAPALASSLPFGYGPVDLQTAYGLSNLSANEGTGRTVAIVDAQDDPNAEADLAVYRSTYGLSACTTANGCFKKVDQNGGTSYPAPDPGWAGEISLDLDMVSAIAPNAHILLVEANTASSADLGAAVNTAAALGATEISNSYGSSGDTGKAGDLAYYDHPGIAVFASSGDSGWNTIDDVGTFPGVGSADFPATSPDVTAVGGTSLDSTSPRSETVWGDWEADPFFGPFSGAGSGCSSFVPKPTWQTDSACSTRSVADVSAVADPFTGVATYNTYGGGGWDTTGGTSAASPIMAGVAAISPPTYFQPGFSYSHLADFNDVTVGSNDAVFGPPFCGNAQCNAGAGWDGPTGNGTPNGTTIPVPPSASVAAPGNGAVYTRGQTVAANYACTEAANGPGITSCAGTVANGSTIDTSTLGAHTFTVTGTSGDGYTGTASVTYTVQAPPVPPVPPAPPKPSPPAPPKPKAPHITKHPAKKTFATRARFKFKDATKGVTFQCAYGKGTKRHRAFTKCKSPETLHFNPGTHSFYVRAHNANGFSAVAKFTWRIL